MNTAKDKIIKFIDNYVGSHIDAASMPTEDKENLKAHLLGAQEILLRNGHSRLQEVVSGITEAVLSRF